MDQQFPDSVRLTKIILIFYKSMKRKRNDAFPYKGNLLKIPLRMKLTFLLLVCAVVQLFAVVNAQTVSLKKQNAS